MRTFFHYIQNARDSLQANRMRTFLTTSGVAIGVASIVTILSLASGATQLVTEQVDDIGGNVAVIRSGQEKTSSLPDIVNQQARGTISASTLTSDDLTAVEALPNITTVAPITITESTLSGDAKRASTVVGTTPSLFAINKIAMAEGEFEAGDEAPLVIGSQLSINLFGTEDSLGKTIIIKGQSYRVGGIVERQQSPMNFNGIDINSAAFVSPAQLSSINPSAQIQQINIQTSSVARLDSAVATVKKTLLEKHGGEADFRVLTGDDIAAPINQIFSAIAGATAAIAGISLFVGGIGIMNIMLVNVAERTREIGIRKALGASRADIVWQFLIEAIIMALVGGILGGILGLGLAFGISLFLTFDPTITWHVASASIGVASAIGVIFGLYPALRAAHKDPIEALNQHL